MGISVGGKALAGGFGKGNLGGGLGKSLNRVSLELGGGAPIFREHSQDRGLMPKANRMQMVG